MDNLNALFISFLDNTDPEIDIKKFLFPNLPTFIAHLIAMAVLITIIVYLVWKPYKRFLKARHDYIAQNIEQAENIKLDAEALTKETQQKMLELKSLSSQLTQQAKTEAENLKRNLINTANKEASIIRQKTEVEVNLMQKNAEKDIKNQVTDIAWNLAEKIIGKNIDKKTNDKLVNDFIKELDK